MPSVFSRHSGTTSKSVKKDCGCKGKKKQESAEQTASAEPKMEELMATHDDKEHEPANVAEIVNIGGEA